MSHAASWLRTPVVRLKTGIGTRCIASAIKSCQSLLKTKDTSLQKALARKGFGAARAYIELLGSYTPQMDPARPPVSKKTRGGSRGVTALHVRKGYRTLLVTMIYFALIASTPWLDLGGTGSRLGQS